MTNCPRSLKKPELEKGIGLSVPESYSNPAFSMQPSFPACMKAVVSLSDADRETEKSAGVLMHKVSFCCTTTFWEHYCGEDPMCFICL